METNNNLNQSLQLQIDKLANELDKERNTISQLRTSIDVLQASWAIDKDKLTEAVEKLNEIDDNVGKVEDLVDNDTPPKDNKCDKKRMTTRSVSSNKQPRGDGWSTGKKSLSGPQNISLACPLCCNELFVSREALKNHLLKFFNNVECPICSRNCVNIPSLIYHLDVGCGNNQVSKPKGQSNKANLSIVGKNTLSIISFKMPEDNCDIDQNLFDSLIVTEENNEMLFSKMRSDKTKAHMDKINTNELHEKSKVVNNENMKPLKKEIVDSEMEVVQDQEAEVSDVEEEMAVDDTNSNGSDSEAEKEEYFCSACDLSFTSIIEHIKEHHFGEEVKIEGAPEEVKKKLLTCGSVVKDGNGTECTLQETESSSGKHSPETNTRQNKEENNHVDNILGYWTRKGSHFIYVKDEDKLKLLYPTFVPSHFKVKPLVDNNNKQNKLPFNKLDLIQLVDDNSLVSGAVQALIGIYVVDENKAKDRFKLGPTAKFISALHRTRVKIENNDEVEELNSKGNSRMMERQKARSDQYIQVLRVPLGRDRDITIENINFDLLPSIPDHMVPYLENVTNPVIPLLKGAKQLKWKCSICLSQIPSIFLLSKAHVCYKCKYCGKGFRKNIGCFMKHLLACGKNKASAEKPFACSCCPSFFKTIEEAREHTPLHFPGSRAVQCSLCYILLEDKRVLNQHLKTEHDTNISQIGIEVKQPRLNAKTKYRIENPPPCATPSETNKSKCETNAKNLDSTEIFPEVQIKEEVEDEDDDFGYLTPRSSRKRKANKTYFDECYLYYE